MRDVRLQDGYSFIFICQFQIRCQLSVMICRMNRQWKELFKLYKALPYIIYRRKYLIPAPPKNPPINPTYSRHPLRILQKAYPSLMTSQFYINKEDPQYQQLFKKLYLQEKNKEKQAYRQRLKQYNTRISALLNNFSKHYPIMLYYNEQLKGKVQIKGKSRFTITKDLYMKLDQEKRQRYEEMSVKIRQQERQKYKDFHQKYSIPAIIDIKPQTLLEHDLIKNQMDTTRIKSKFMALNQAEMQSYCKRSQQIRQNQMKQFHDFLRQKNLDITQFEYIRSICQKVREIRATTLKEQRKSKTSLLSDQDSSSQSQSSSQSTEQTKIEDLQKQQQSEQVPIQSQTKKQKKMPKN